MTRTTQRVLCAFLVVWLLGCRTPTPPVDTVSQVDATHEQRRLFAPSWKGKPIVAGISYGPYRLGQAPGGPDPSDAQVREDLHIISKHWNMLRVYGSRGPTESILRVIRDDNLPIVVVVGAWIAPDDPKSNDAEVDAAIRLANTYVAEVAAVSVGNETQVSWSGHRSPPEPLIKHLRRVRKAIQQPVTTADDYNFWNKPESQAVASEVDFVMLHAYAMWNQQTLEAAVPWTAEVVASIKAHHPSHQIVLAETGWATDLNPEGNETQHIHAPAGEDEQAKFYARFTTWAAQAQQPYFYFSAFDEPWKGSDNPREVEKHWGLFREDRSPKPAIQ